MNILATSRHFLRAHRCVVRATRATGFGTHYPAVSGRCVKAPSLSECFKVPGLLQSHSHSLRSCASVRTFSSLSSPPSPSPGTAATKGADVPSKSCESQVSKDGESQGQPKSSKEKLKLLWRKYGWLSVGTYLGIYASTLSGIFVSLEFDLFNAATFGLDTATLVDMFCHTVERVTGATHIAEFVRSNPKVGTFAIAYIMTKFTEPLRLGATVIAVPRISNALGHRKHEHHQQ